MVLPLLSTEQRRNGRSSLEVVAVLLWELGFPLDVFIAGPNTDGV